MADRWRQWVGMPGFVTAATLAGPLPVQPTGAERAVDGFLAAFAAGDLDAMVALHAPDAILLPPLGGPPLVGREAIRGHYGRIFAATSARRIVPTEEHWQALGDRIALRTAEALVEQEFPDGRRAITPARLSAVFRRDAEGWRIVQMHSCARMPH